MEEWTIYNRNRMPTDRTILRGTRLEKDEYHVVVHVCIFNSREQMLIQQRQSFKDGWPNMWDLSVGGSSIAGESSSMAAERELFEELGYQADFSEERPYFTINFRCGFDDYYIIEDDVDMESLTLQYEEVQDVIWASKDEILKMIDERKFVPYHKSLVEMIFDMKSNRGCHYE